MASPQTIHLHQPEHPPGYHVIREFCGSSVPCHRAPRSCSSWHELGIIILWMLPRRSWHWPGKARVFKPRATNFSQDKDVSRSLRSCKKLAVSTPL